MAIDSAKRAHFKEEARREMREFMVITLYLAILFGAFTLYRRLSYAELGIGYLAYGFKLIEALVIAKVILIGEAIGLGRGSEHRPLAVSVAVKTFLFSILIAAFNLLEHAIGGRVHGQSWGQAFMSITDKGMDEMLARTLVLVIALVPFFAFLELNRVLGPGKLSALFFSRRSGES